MVCVWCGRGGSLLKDQKEMSWLMKTLPKVETELKRLAHDFEKEHGKKVMILGRQIPQMIDEDWQLFHEEKTKRKNHVKPKVSTFNSPVLFWLFNIFYMFCFSFFSFQLRLVDKEIVSAHKANDRETSSSEVEWYAVKKKMLGPKWSRDSITLIINLNFPNFFHLITLHAHPSSTKI